MKKRSKAMVYIMIGLVLLIILSLLCLFTPVANRVGGWVGKTGDQIKSIAQTVAGIALGILLVTWGIAALEIPPLGIGMIVAGLGMLGWNIYPLFSSSTTTVSTDTSSSL